MNGIARRQRGATLIELLVVLAVLGIALSVVTLSAPSAAPRDASPLEHAIAAARRDAVENGRRVSTRVGFNGSTVLITALPDGRVLTDSVLAPPMERSLQ